MIPRQIRNFIETFRKLPAIGPRQATRLAFYISKLKLQERKALGEALTALDNLDQCPECFFIKEKERGTCVICKNENRTEPIIAIVEKDADLLSIERSGEFRGTYLILGEITPGGILEASHKARLMRLKQQIEKNEKKPEEVILALGPSSISDMLYETVRKSLEHVNVKVTRLGRGIPTGGEIEFADEETLKSALKRRI